VISLTLGIALGVPIGLLFSLGAILIMLVRFPVNFVLTYKIVILTVVFKRRLKLLVLIALTIVHIIYPIIASVLVVSGSVIILSGIFSYKSIIELKTIFKTPSKDCLIFWMTTGRCRNISQKICSRPMMIQLNWHSFQLGWAAL
jgi:hypothetical protein